MTRCESGPEKNAQVQACTRGGEGGRRGGGGLSGPEKWARSQACRGGEGG